MIPDDLSGLINPLPIGRLLGKIGALAATEGFRTAVVGGFVRDLLLGRISHDIDIVVEGDAVKLAQRLSKAMGGQILQISRFGTASIMLASQRIDLASARVESYNRPGALPIVSSSTIEQDLLRRDFSINAMAAELNSTHFGRLIDTVDGWRDLQNKQLRILHKASFSDDATRLLRGLRFCHRLGFSFEHETEWLFRAAVAKRLWSTLSAARLGRELRLILEEPAWADLFTHMANIGMFEPLFNSSLDAGKQTALSQVDSAQMYFAAYGIKIQVAAVVALVIGAGGGIMLSGVAGKTDVAYSETVKKLDLVYANLSDKRIRPHDIFVVLSGITPAELAYLWIICQNEEVKARIRLYTENLRRIKPFLSGGQIAAIVGKGPQVEKIRQQLLYAKMDEELLTLSDEITFVSSRVDSLKKEDN